MTTIIPELDITDFYSDDEDYEEKKADFSKNFATENLI